MDSKIAYPEHQQYPGVHQPPPAYSQPTPGAAGYSQPYMTQGGVSQPYVGGIQTVVVAQPARPVIVQLAPASYVGHIILSCFVFWCCGCICGLIAFILAVMAANSSPSEAASARSLGRASFWASITGIIIGCIIIAIVIGVQVTGSKKTVKTPSCYTEYKTVCDYSSFGTCRRYQAQLTYNCY